MMKILVTAAIFVVLASSFANVEAKINFGLKQDTDVGAKGGINFNFGFQNQNVKKNQVVILPPGLNDHWGRNPGGVKRRYPEIWLKHNQEADKILNYNWCWWMHYHRRESTAECKNLPPYTGLFPTEELRTLPSPEGAVNETTREMLTSDLKPPKSIKWTAKESQPKSKKRSAPEPDEAEEEKPKAMKGAAAEPKDAEPGQTAGIIKPELPPLPAPVTTPMPKDAQVCKINKEVYHDFVADGTRHIFYIKEKKRWIDGYIFCKMNGMEMLKVEDDVENDANIEYLASIGMAPKDGVWLGATSRLDDPARPESKNFVWMSDGTRLTKYTGWGDGQPKRGIGNAFCVQYYHNPTYGNIHWSVNNCDEKWPFFCVKDLAPAKCNPPTVASVK